MLNKRYWSLYLNRTWVYYKFYGDRLILVDGGVFKEKLWIPLSNIERSLFPDEENLYFTEKRFSKWGDEHFCLKKDLLVPEEIASNLLCMPESKGRSKGETIPDDIQQKLEEFYYPNNRKAGVDFSWL